MRRIGVICLFALLATPALPRAADAPPDPLALLPDSADFVIQLRQPHDLIKGLLTRPAVEDLLGLAVAREVLDLPAVRTGRDILAHFEKKFAAWPALLEKLAGKGVTLGGSYGDRKPRLLMVLQGTDAETMRAFVPEALKVLADELGLPDADAAIKKGEFAGVPVTGLGDDLCMAQIDATLVIATQRPLLKQALEAHRAGSGGLSSSAGVKQARATLPPDPAAWAWFQLAAFKKLDGIPELLAMPRNNFLLTFAFAGWLDVLRRADFLAVSLQDRPEGYELSLHLPAGRDGRGGDVVLHLPDDPAQPASLPPLLPQGVLLSHSFYQDLGAMWTQRAKVFNPESVKDFENLQREISRVTVNTSFDSLLTQLGAHHRFVVAQPAKPPYARRPAQSLPALGHVVSLRDDAAAGPIEAMLRAGGLVAYSQLGARLYEEEHAGVKLFGYRFPENKELPDDEGGYRFNFKPAFAHVKGSYVAASTPELCRELIDLVQAEAKSPPARGEDQGRNMRLRFSADGLARGLQADPEAFITQAILARGLTPEEAKAESAKTLGYLRKLGELTAETRWQADRFDFTFRLNFGK